MNTRHILYCTLLSATLYTSCTDTISEVVAPDYVQYMPGNFAEVSYPTDNEHTSERWKLGRKLFYDPVLSIDSSKSCSSCHKSHLAFSDSVSLSKGVKGREGTSNSPSLSNVAFHPYYTRAGGVPSLEMQVLVPLQEHNEFDFNILDAGKKIAKDSTYQNMSLLAYGISPDYSVITRALATFERSLVSNKSPFDQYHYKNNTKALDTEQKKGMALFYSTKTNCFKCHGGFNFTTYSFENNGLYEAYQDMGRHRLTKKETDISRFKTPSLRNVEVTAPYMHDGSMSTLTQVIEHYNNGGKKHPNKSTFIKPLHLSPIEKEQLLAFLTSLTDQSFISNKEYKKP